MLLANPTMDFLKGFNKFVHLVEKQGQRPRSSALLFFLSRCCHKYVSHGAEAIVFLAFFLYGMGFYRRLSKSRESDTFKHFRRIGYVLQIIRIFLVAFVLLHILVGKQVSIVSRVLGKDKDAVMEPERIETHYTMASTLLDHEQPLWKDVIYFFGFDRLHVLALDVLFDLVVLGLNVALAFALENVVLRQLNSFKFRFPWTKRQTAEDYLVGVVTRSRSKLLNH